MNPAGEKGQASVQLVMQVHRRGEQYHGTLARPGDQRSLPFTGLLELIAALERLTTPEADVREPSQ